MMGTSRDLDGVIEASGYVEALFEHRGDLFPQKAVLFRKVQQRDLHVSSLAGKRTGRPERIIGPSPT